jgi:hypothetical protein
MVISVIGLFMLLRFRGTLVPLKSEFKGISSNFAYFQSGIYRLALKERRLKVNSGKNFRRLSSTTIFTIEKPIEVV